MIGERAALLGRSKGPSLPLLVPLSLSITVLSHTRIRFHSCTGTQSRIVQSPLPRLFFLIRIHTLTSAQCVRDTQRPLVINSAAGKPNEWSMSGRAVAFDRHAQPDPCATTHPVQSDRLNPKPAGLPSIREHSNCEFKLWK